MSTADLERAARELEAALEAETAALKAADLLGATRLAAAKTEALEAFQAARARLAPSGLASASRLAVQIDRLREAVERNRLALERGIALQGRVIQTIARAAAQPAVAAPGYARAARPGAAPLALAIRA